MSQRDIIDFSALEKELKAAVESERKYQQENQAKLRAVSQGVDYDQFRGLVLTSHLKPLDKKDRDGGPRKQPWNPAGWSNLHPVQTLWCDPAVCSSRFMKSLASGVLF
uniref:Coiled-coil domain containing 103 n=1 Tax=Poecilia latipinna TaxID=48699 RepID=A0A3B3V9D2_9TELE